MVKISELLNRDRFVTILTHRSGTVIDCGRQDVSDGVKVRFDDGEEKNLHVGVKVRML